MSRGGMMGGRIRGEKGLTTRRPTMIAMLVTAQKWGVILLVRVRLGVRIWPGMSGSGCRIGMARIRVIRKLIHLDQKQGRTVFCAAVRGTISISTLARRVALTTFRRLVTALSVFAVPEILDFIILDPFYPFTLWEHGFRTDCTDCPRLCPLGGDIGGVPPFAAV